MSTRRSYRSRARYRLDRVLARGTVAVILWLGVVTGAVVLVTGTLLSVLDIVVHGKRVGVVEGIWHNLLRTLEPAAMEADVGWPRRLQSLFVVLFGILFRAPPVAADWDRLPVRTSIERSPWTLR